jgi:hypothetical protein
VEAEEARQAHELQLDVGVARGNPLAQLFRKEAPIVAGAHQGPAGVACMTSRGN